MRIKTSVNKYRFDKERQGDLNNLQIANNQFWAEEHAKMAKRQNEK